jgi:hypothetical protein
MVEQGSERAPTGQALAEVEPQERLAPSGFDPSRMRLAHEELQGCMIRRSGHTCEVRKEFLDVALRSLREGIRWVNTSDGPDENAPAERIVSALARDADEVEACGAGNEAANMRRAANLIRFYHNALCEVVSWHADARDVFPDWETTARALAEIADCATRGEDWLSDSDGSPKGGGAKQDAVHDSAGPQGHRPTSGDTTNQREDEGNG